MLASLVRAQSSCIEIECVCLFFAFFRETIVLFSIFLVVISFNLFVNELINYLFVFQFCLTLCQIETC